MNKEIRELIFATGNSHKLEEVRQILEGKYRIFGLSDLGFHDEIPEPAPTLEGNAIIKARFVKEKFNKDCFSEDTGLEVLALKGAPGVLSARFAGEQKDAKANMALLLEKMKDKTDRSCQFRTIIALILDGKEYTFEGIVKGTLLNVPKGSGGFGYDPIFMPDGYDKSFGELSAKIKNQFSHRAKAVAKLNDFLLTYQFS